MTVAAVPIRHRSGRVAYAAHLVHQRGPRTVCVHHNGHRTVAAAFRCGRRLLSVRRRFAAHP